jgi:hypothetical protein
MPKKNIEQLDELKKSTLGSYVKKASADAVDKMDDSGQELSFGDPEVGMKLSDKAGKRLAGVSKATDRLTKEDYVSEDEGFDVDPEIHARNVERTRKRLNRMPGFTKMNSPEKQQRIADKITKHTYLGHTFDGAFRLAHIGESIASDTLKADSRSDDSNPKSKIAAINAVIGSMNAMSSDELTKWYTSAMALIGKEASALPGSANSDSNKSSLNMKGSAAVGSGGASAADPMPKLDHKNNPLASMKEDVEEMFVGTELSEEFKDKATTLFEAAVNARATLEIARLEEEFEAAYEERLEEEVTSIVENVETNLDTYMNYVVEKWMEDNQVAIESSLRNEIMEEFIGGLKGLFAEHYINVPEEKVDVIEAMAQKIETLENALNESINDANELKSVLAEAKMSSLIDELSEGLTMSQAEKFAALAEGVSFDGNFNSYKSKLEMVKETYFSMKPKTSNIEEETFESDEESVNTVNMDPHVSNYVRAIARTTKK